MIVLKSEREIALMRRAGALVARVLQELGKAVAPGVRLSDLDRLAEDIIRSAGAVPAFKHYGEIPGQRPPFPASICASLNEQVVHGVPDGRRLREGDVLSVDVGAFLEGFCGDAAATFPVGRISPLAEKLLRVTREALMAGVAMAVPGNHLSDISHAVQTYAEKNGFSVVREFVGHGVGREMHEDPQVPNFGPPGLGPVLRPGMTLAIEPMVNAGGPEVVVLGDGWTVVTADGSLSAHFEHSVAVTTDTPLILTWPEEEG
ncbi:MAG TPA: type I methionyl aminopeptidase [Firmicutes bacterium]|nr:type I methionyl aminopeptidase [Bacillota bacterium]